MVLTAVFSSHFDAGCKTPDCGKRVKGEPDRCATVGPGHAPLTNMGEPWAYHIVNRYFDEYIADAVNYTNSSNNNIEYKYVMAAIPSFDIVYKKQCIRFGGLKTNIHITCGMG